MYVRCWENAGVTRIYIVLRIYTILISSLLNYLIKSDKDRTPGTKRKKNRNFTETTGFSEFLNFFRLNAAKENEEPEKGARQRQTEFKLANMCTWSEEPEIVCPLNQQIQRRDTSIIECREKMLFARAWGKLLTRSLSETSCLLAAFR